MDIWEISRLRSLQLSDVLDLPLPLSLEREALSLQLAIPPFFYSFTQQILSSDALGLTVLQGVKEEHVMDKKTKMEIIRPV